MNTIKKACAIFAASSLTSIYGAITVITDADTFTQGLAGISNEDFSSAPVHFNFGGSSRDTAIPEGVETDLGVFSVFYTTKNSVNDAFYTANVSEAINNDQQLSIRYDHDEGGDPSATTVLEFRFETPIKAFGATWNAVSPTRNFSFRTDTSPDIVNLAVTLDSAPIEFVQPSQDGGFLGVHSDVAFTRIVFSGTGNDYVVLDDAVVATAIPEPVTATYLSLIIYLVVLSRRKNHNNKENAFNATR